MNETKFCHHCGETIAKQAEICPKCGVRQMAAPLSFGGNVSGRNRMVAVILAFLLGGIGMHKFYLGQVGMGIFYLIFSWTFIPAVVAFIEGIMMLVMSDDEFAAKYP